MEIRMTRKALGFVLPLVLRALKLKLPESRAQLDELAEALNNGELPKKN